jgi:hypothetical protein
MSERFDDLRARYTSPSTIAWPLWERLFGVVRVVDGGSRKRRQVGEASWSNDESEREGKKTMTAAVTMTIAAM